jgi:hypothetical protein
MSKVESRFSPGHLSNGPAKGLVTLLPELR